MTRYRGEAEQARKLENLGEFVRALITFAL
ncbi:hypothetical protein O9993_01265 [Vibrio lentus]|nr:hypothetical protein [Vibrio lentus]